MRSWRIDCQLWEIGENPMWSELIVTQQAEHLAKRKELWEMRNNANSVRETPGRPKGFAGETAEAQAFEQDAVTN